MLGAALLTSRAVSVTTATDWVIPLAGTTVATEAGDSCTRAAKPTEVILQYT
jgi:hypothetical protein